MPRPLTRKSTSSVSRSMNSRAKSTPGVPVDNAPLASRGYSVGETSNRCVVPREIDIELFAGAGGLALGLQQAGFIPDYLFEIDKHSCVTMRANHISKKGLLHGEIKEGDIREVDWSNYRMPVRLLAGGAPCQPFSLGGKHLANRDGRNLFPEVLRAIRSLRPLVIVLENVQGLTRPSFQPYFDYIVRQIEFPSISPRPDELWGEHDKRIKQHQYSCNREPEYHVEWKVLNAADYGVPQNRRRVFFVATRADSLPKFEFPPPTHSRTALIADQQSGLYWVRHEMKPRELQTPQPGRLNGALFNENRLQAWRTVRDTLMNPRLPPPAKSEKESRNNHWEIPGARLYAGHAGSDLDWPAKTIKAGVHGVPGGENIVRLDDGSFRYFTLRETARIQSFPDEYIFEGARSQITRQIGNAVPCLLAMLVGDSVMRLLESANTTSKKTKSLFR